MSEASVIDASLDYGCYTRVAAASLEECQSLCSLDLSCKAIEVNPAGDHCELWSCLPTMTSGTSNYYCYFRETGNSFFQ